MFVNLSILSNGKNIRSLSKKGRCKKEERKKQNSHKKSYPSKLTRNNKTIKRSGK